MEVITLAGVHILDQKEALAEEEVVEAVHKNNLMIREKFYEGMEDFHHTLTYSNGRKHSYACFNALKLGEEFVDKVANASEFFFNLLLDKVLPYAILMSVPELIRLGIDYRIAPLLKTEANCENMIARFDVINFNGVPKFIEINSDTPYMQVENFILNDRLLKMFEKPSLLPGILDTYRESVETAVKSTAKWLYKDLDDCLIAVIKPNRDTDPEGYNTSILVLDLIKSLGYKHSFVSMDNILISKDKKSVGIVGKGKVDIIIKPSNPYDFLASEQYEDGSSFGEDLMKLIMLRKVGLINNPQSHLLENKGLFALMWEWMGQEDFYTPQEKDFIEKHIPFTTFNKEHFIVKDVVSISKPTVGRGSNNIDIRVNEFHLASSNRYYSDKPLVYQEFIHAPKRKIIVDGEERVQKELLGVFITGRKFCGITALLSGDVTEDEDCYWAAVYK